MTKSALIVVDVQNDFCEGGALAVAGGNDVAEGIAQHIIKHWDAYDIIVFTADWHNAPPDTNGGHFGDPPDFVDSWPVHCVSGTAGAEFHPAILKAQDKLCSLRSLRSPWYPETHIFRKGQGFPHYSGFQGYNGLQENLYDMLDEHKIERTYITGLAGDYCVKQTALSAKKSYDVRFLKKFIASVHGDAATDAAVQEVELYRGN